MTNPSRGALPGGAATVALGAQAPAPRNDRLIRGSEVVDTRNNRRRGDQWPKPAQTVRAERPLGRPCA